MLFSHITSESISRQRQSHLTFVNSRVKIAIISLHITQNLKFDNLRVNFPDLGVIYCKTHSEKLS
jgi:hypothetical protein